MGRIAAVIAIIAAVVSLLIHIFHPSIKVINLIVLYVAKCQKRKRDTLDPYCFSYVFQKRKKETLESSGVQ